ncbi:HEPN domain-containing protein [Candidatus Micrarchaeota archaeon]|nr:HEPN domain-containing protein [Candidatus Micrarchaeota archaeon]
MEKNVSRERYLIFKKKADEYYAGMEKEYGNGRYNNCVTMGVHCTISYVDAFTVYKLGTKSSAQNHAQAINLLKDAKALDEKEKARVCNLLSQIIEMKTPAEYEDRKISKAEAQKTKHLCESIQKFFEKEFEKIERQ